MNPVEELMGRRQIDALIKADPVSIVLSRDQWVSDGVGGKKKAPTSQVLEPQTATLIPFKRRMTEFLVNTELGDVPDLPYVLVGHHDMDIQRGDRFTHAGDEYEVQTLDLKRNVRVACHIDYFGGTSNG